MSLTCYIGFLRLRSLKNPLSGKQFFENGIHYENGKLFMYPDIHVATTDLDNDGFDEIIVTVSEPDEEFKGLFCEPEYMCPHYILQDRNFPGEKRRLSRFKVMGPIYTIGLGLSTDEVVGGYRSFRAYTDLKLKKFDVYQYDKKNDNYYNVSLPNAGGQP